MAEQDPELKAIELVYNRFLNRCNYAASIISLTRHFPTFSFKLELKIEYKQDVERIEKETRNFFDNIDARPMCIITYVKKE